MNDINQLNLFSKDEIEIEVDTRVCIECDEEKPLKSFEYSTLAYKGYRGSCIECRNKSRRIRRAYRRQYREPNDDYSCPICGRTKDQRSKGRTGKSWAIDHCHKTGHVRGFLCQNCNSGLGLLKDDINLLEKGIEWLRKHEGEKTNDTE